MAALAARPPQPFRLEDIEEKPKRVIKSKRYADRLGLTKLDPAYGNDLFEIIQCIELGTRLPGRFYRKRKGLDMDKALADFGVMHLHLGGQNSNVLLFLFQFSDRVVLLEINNHYHFMTNPPGITLFQTHWRQTAAQIIIAEADRTESIKGLNTKIREKLGLDKTST